MNGLARKAEAPAAKLLAMSLMSSSAEIIIIGIRISRFSVRM